MRNESFMEWRVSLEGQKTPRMLRCSLGCSVYGCDCTLELAQGCPEANTRQVRRIHS